MTRGQRAAHAFVWSALAILLSLVVVGALAARTGATDAARTVAREAR